MNRTVQIGAAILGGLMVMAAAPFDVREVYGKKTEDLLYMCVNGGDPCRDFINDVLKTLNVETAIRPVRYYKGCAPAPLSPEQTDQLVLWLLSRPSLSTGYAAQDIAMAAEDLWPCK